ncbi:Rrf2 family transcriptional regulator [Phormidium tenue FACHB-886]|nr:Rrf2 family transcriptional regulator [Phormidium tenue FACHB-886]
MELSNKTEYALLAMLSLAVHYNDDEPLQIRQIAVEQNIPNRYLDQLLAELRRGGLIRSERGAKGGYWLAQAPEKTTVLSILNCIEGADWQDTESKGDVNASEKGVILKIWQEAKQAARVVLQKYTLQDLVEKREAWQRPIMYYI